MKYSVILFLVFGIVASAEVIDVPSIRSQKDLDGLYHEATEPKNLPSSDLVLSHNGEAIPPKSSDPDAPTKPGFYHDNIRYRFISVHFRNSIQRQRMILSSGSKEPLN